MELSAATTLDNPFAVLINPVVAQAVTSVSSVATGIAKNPAPILQAIVLNQIDNAKTLANAANTTVTQLGTAAHMAPAVLEVVGNYLRQGELQNAYSTLFMWALTPVLTVALSVLPQVLPMITNPIDRLSAAIKAAEETGMMSVMGLVPMLAQAPQLLLGGVQEAVAAVRAGDPIMAANALMKSTADALTLSLQFAGSIANGLLVKTPQAIATAIRPTLDFTSTSLLNVSRTETPTATDTVVADRAADTVVADQAAAVATAKAKAVAVTPETEPEVKTEKVVATDAVSDPQATDSDASTPDAAPKAGTIVRNSPKAEPGKPGIATKRAGSEVKEAVDSVGKEINSTVKKISDGLKNGFG
ncbi:hypothetical protein, partial [Mycolicibacterium sp. CBMA 295]